MTQTTTRTRSIRQQATVARNLNEQRTLSRSTLEATVLIEGIDAPVIKCRAKSDFYKGRVTVREGQEFFLVRSSKFQHRYYVVAWERLSWKCSCYCVCSHNEHCMIVNQWVVDHVVRPQREKVLATQEPSIAASVESVAQTDEQPCVSHVTNSSEESVQVVKLASVAENDAPRPRTAQEWKVAIAAQKEADAAYNRVYLDEARKLRNAS